MRTQKKSTRTRPPKKNRQKKEKCTACGDGQSQQKDGITVERPVIRYSGSPERSPRFCANVSDSYSDGRRRFLWDSRQGQSRSQLRTNFDREMLGIGRTGPTRQALSNSQSKRWEINSVEGVSVHSQTCRRGTGEALRICNQYRGTREIEPGIRRVVDGMANLSHRLRAIGNGQDPGVVAAAWTILTEGWNDC